MSAETTDPRPWGRRRLLVGTVGVVLLGVGGWLFLADVPVSQWVRALVWLAGGVAVHDGFVAPAAAGLGRLGRGRAPRRLAPVARVAVLGAVTVALLAVPLLATGGLRG